MGKIHPLFISACIGMLLFGIVMISLGTINTFLIQKLDLDELTAASLATLLPFGILVGSLLFGPIVDRFGYKIVFISCSMFITVAIEAIAFAVNLTIIQFAFFLIGLGGGAINGSTNSLVADISPEYKGAKLSLLGVYYGIGALGMPIVLGAFSNYCQYENIIKIIGIITLLPTLYFVCLRFPEPKHKQGFPLKDGFGLLKEKTLILFGTILFFESGIEGITNNWTTTYLQKSLGIGSTEALYALSGMVIALSLSRLILGNLLKRIQPYLIAYICFGFIATGSFILMLGSSYLTSIVGLIFLGIGFAAGFPVILGYIGELYPGLSGTAFSVVFTIALIGNTMINYLVGIVTHHVGIRHYLTIIPVCVTIMIVLFSIVCNQIKGSIKI